LASRYAPALALAVFLEIIVIAALPLLVLSSALTAFPWLLLRLFQLQLQFLHFPWSIHLPHPSTDSDTVPKSSTSTAHLLQLINAFAPDPARATPRVLFRF
jgi:hypothetical protein